jgi:hypothetical protein
MAADDGVAAAQWLVKQIEADDPGPVASMGKTMTEALMSAETDTLRGAVLGERSSKRTHSRNGYWACAGSGPLRGTPESAPFDETPSTLGVQRRVAWRRRMPSS